MRKFYEKKLNPRNYTLGILIPIILLICVFAVGCIDGGTEVGSYPQNMKATVTVTVTLEDGNKYTVDVHDKNVTVNTYGSANPESWEVVNW